MIKYLAKDEKLTDLVSDGTYVVDFYAEWCGPCKMLGSVLEGMEDVNIIKINVDEHQDIAAEFNVMSIPKIVTFKNGVNTGEKVGYATEEEIRKMLEK